MDIILKFAKDKRTKRWFWVPQGTVPRGHDIIATGEINIEISEEELENGADNYVLSSNPQAPDLLEEVTRCHNTIGEYEKSLTEKEEVMKRLKEEIEKAINRYYNNYGDYVDVLKQAMEKADGR